MSNYVLRITKERIIPPEDRGREYQRGFGPLDPGPLVNVERALEVAITEDEWRKLKVAVLKAFEESV